MPIQVLNQITIDKIAAGEVIVRPVNAMKELIENSLDANADTIEVTVFDHCLKQIKVKDNGNGINVHDLSLLCHRYATSKLQQLDDLYYLTTFGFRGEALASISNVANITVYTKTEDSPCGFQATFKEGSMLKKPTLCACTKGTSILIENLFQNTPIRLKGMKPSIEYKKMMECIERYAIHYYDVCFILKKNTVQFQVKKASNQIERLQSIYHCQQLNAWKTVEWKDHQFEFHLTFTLEQTNNNASAFILFVNGRWVENRNIKRKVYEAFQPHKPSVVYLSLKVFDLSQIDVNIHPSKNEVALLNEDTFIQIICQSLTDEILATCIQKKMKKTVELPKMKTLDVYFKTPVQTHHKKNKSDDLSVVPQMKQAKKNKKDMSFVIQQLQQQVMEVEDKEASILFSQQEYIGYIKDLLVISKYQDSFYLFNINMISEEFFYQVMLNRFGKYGRFILQPAISIKKCSELIGISDFTSSLFQHQSILDYFNISLKDNALTSLPMLMCNYLPTLDKIPLFLYRIMTTVDWCNEIQCFQDICRECSQLYSCTNQTQYEQIRNDLSLMHVPYYIVKDEYLVEFDIPCLN